jgi:PAS domain S-box-containing protein
VGSAAPIPADEQARLDALRALNVLDTPAEERFDRITRVAAHLFGAPMAMVSLVDADRHFLKACVGLDRATIPRDIGFCSHAILTDEPLVVEDTHADERFVDNPLVTGPPHLRFYVGEPLRAPGGARVGTLCVLDHEPRRVTRAELDALRDLARWVESELANIELGAALAAQREGDELVEGILRATVEGIIGMDREGCIVFANPAAVRMLGWSEDELIGHVAHDLFHHSHADGSPFRWEECPTRRAVTHAETVHLEDVFWRRDGTSFPCESLTAPLRRDGEVIGAVSSFLDVSQRREVERMKDEFASVVGHELRTPLTSIRASLGLLAGGVLGELPGDAAQVVETAVENTERLVRLINDTLDLERIEAGVAPLNLRPQMAADLIRDAAAVVAPMAVEAGVEVVSAPGGGETVLADRDRVVQALTNLIGNAVKFSPRGETVTVGAERDRYEVVFSVTDRGRGVPVDQQQAIFERFVQVDASDARDRGGTGLGLAIARRIVEIHGGRIWVSSTPGEGATFGLTLQAVAA